MILMILIPNSFFQSEGKSGKKPELATVIAPYSATGKEQLNLQGGQMILVRKKTDTGWWQGEIQASGTVRSQFIDNYIITSNYFKGNQRPQEANRLVSCILRQVDGCWW